MRKSYGERLSMAAATLVDTLVEVGVVAPFDWKGGPGSGNWGHAGRPGERGGSSPESGGGSPAPAPRAVGADSRQYMAANAQRFTGDDMDFSALILNSCGLKVAGRVQMALNEMGGYDDVSTRIIRGADGTIRAVVMSLEHASSGGVDINQTHVVVMNERYATFDERDAELAAIRNEAMQMSNGDLQIDTQNMDYDQPGMHYTDVISGKECLAARFAAAEPLLDLSEPPAGGLGDYGILLAGEDPDDVSRLKNWVMLTVAVRLNGNADFERVAALYGGQSLYGNDPLERTASYLVNKWATTSGDTDAMSVSIQQAVTQEFGLTPYVPVSEDAGFRANNDVSDSIRPGLRAFARAQYEGTQEALKAQGIEYIDVVRGVGLPPGALPEGKSDQEMKLQPISSWSTNINIAMGFAQSSATDIDVMKGMTTILHARIPRERVFSYARTGVGCSGEEEVVVLGGSTPEPVRVYSAAASKVRSSIVSREFSPSALGWGT